MALAFGCVETRHWYLAQLKPGGLQRASENLSRQGFPVFMPHRTETRRRASRLHETRRPLFPGYLFVQIDPEARPWRTVNSTWGVSRLVSFGPDGPREVPAPLVAGLMARTDGAGGWCEADALRAGDRVRIIAGPFAQAIAEIDAISERGRIFALLEMMGRTVRTELAPEDLESL
jgi:transcriptional antiterminator RfaH